MNPSRLVSLLAAILLLPLSVVAEFRSETIATFSIVGHDPETGEWGVAVQSKFFAVGSVVPYAEAGVGAIASQAYGNTTFGPRGLALLKSGKSPEETLAALLADDELRDQRQVGIVGPTGEVAAHTGAKCMAWAGHRTGKYYTAQGNILTGEDVVEAMARAFEETDGMLGEKLMRALEAGQEKGGDSRGMQSAAIYIAKAEGGYAGYNDVYCDLRVDDHTEPIKELRRIFGLWKVNALVLEGYRQLEKGSFDRAIAAGIEATQLAPNDGETHYHLGCYYSRAGKSDLALESLTRAHAISPALGVRASSDPDYEPLYEREEFKKLAETVK